MNKVQQQAAKVINKHLLEMRRMMPRQFDVDVFNEAKEEVARAMANTFILSNPGMDKEAFISECTKEV